MGFGGGPRDDVAGVDTFRPAAPVASSGPTAESVAFDAEAGEGFPVPYHPPPTDLDFHRLARELAEPPVFDPTASSSSSPVPSPRGAVAGGPPSARPDDVGGSDAPADASRRPTSPVGEGYLGGRGGCFPLPDLSHKLRRHVCSCICLV